MSPGWSPARTIPTPAPFEKARGRVVTLPPGGRYVAETVLEVLASPEEVTEVEAEIRQLQARVQPTIHQQPVEPFSPAS